METQQVLSTTTGELVYQLASIIISAVVAVIGAYVKNWLKTSKLNQEYNFYNDRLERILNNAVQYAELKGKELAKKGIEKRKLALKYIEMVSPDVIHKEGEKLETMLDRKVAQVFKK